MFLKSFQEMEGVGRGQSNRAQGEEQQLKVRGVWCLAVVGDRNGEGEEWREGSRRSPFG